MDARGPLDVGLPIGEAASRLGISIPALRKRIRRGSVHATKVEGVWRVTLPTSDRVDSPADTGPGQVDAGVDAGRDVLIDELRAHIEDLRGQVASLQRTNEYQAAALAEHARRTPQLPAGENVKEPGTIASRSEPPETPVSAPARRGWLSRLLGR